ncbi:hypothetical protein L3Q82_007393 [Scortum barcoo]|uniref:Uncharacterized protein n=1 Tax=Scortum barcoo TaxID=214431 RepID=A0ACB8WSV1_9TELE|nr:hypothetical protein L3Q82_007393 [Scortum barcoo]
MSPVGALSSTPPRDSKKAGYSVLLFTRPVGTNNSKRPIPNPKAQGSDPLVHRGELQHMAAELGSYKQAHTSLPPLTLEQLQSSGGSSPSQGAGFQSPSHAWRDWVPSRPPPRLLPKPHCTGPSWTFLRVVSLLEGKPTSPFRAEPGRVPWAKTSATRRSPASTNPRPCSSVGPRFGSVACGVGQELYVFGGVRSQENDNPEQRQMMTCKSEFYHDEMRRWMLLDDQTLCIQTSSSFVYGAVPIGASIYVVGDLDTGTSFDYIREFRRSTGTWHRTKPMLPTDLSKTACAALRIANCRLFRLQLSQGMLYDGLNSRRLMSKPPKCLKVYLNDVTPGPSPLSKLIHKVKHKNIINNLIQQSYY